MFQRPISDETLHLATSHRLAARYRECRRIRITLHADKPSRKPGLAGNCPGQSPQRQRQIARASSAINWGICRYRDNGRLARGFTAVQAARSFPTVPPAKKPSTHLFEIGDPAPAGPVSHGNASSYLPSLFSDYLLNRYLCRHALVTLFNHVRLRGFRWCAHTWRRIFRRNRPDARRTPGHPRSKARLAPTVTAGTAHTHSIDHQH